jgi:acetyl esterase/lipase
MDLYYPNTDIDLLNKRPFILLIHGGGFTAGTRKSMTYHAKELSKRGFVVATITYRLGYNREIFGSIQKAVYRAQQDTYTALKYIASQKEKLKIDTSWFFIGGSSAGAVTSLSASYASQAEWNQIAPKFESDMGSLEPSGINLNEIFTIRGIYNFMGAIPPVVFNSGNLIPTISFHGDLDTTVPIGKNTMTGFGSRAIHEMLNEAGVCNDLTVVPNGGHGIYRSKKDVDFRINRVACFFKSLICNTCVDFMAEESIPAVCGN